MFTHKHTNVSVCMFRCVYKGMHVYIRIYLYICYKFFCSLVLLFSINYIESNDNTGVQFLLCVHIHGTLSFAYLNSCFRLLSCWKETDSLNDTWRFCAKTDWYLEVFMIPTILTKTAAPAEEKPPHTMKLPPPCFTVGVVLFGWWAYLVSVPPWSHQTLKHFGKMHRNVQNTWSSCQMQRVTITSQLFHIYLKLC